MGRLRRNAIHMLGSQVSVALFQGVQFVLIARALGPSDFGRMSAILAMTAILLPFSGLGAGNVIVIRLARGSGNAQVYFGNALLVTAITAALLILLYIFWGLIFLPTLATPLVLLIFGVSEILITKLVDITAHVFYGFERHAYSGMIYSFHAFVRMLFAMVFFAIFYHNGELLNYLKPFSDQWLSHLQPFSHILNPSIDHFELWAWLHLISGLLAFVFVTFITIRQIGWPAFNPMLAIKELKTGVFYSIGLSAKSVYINIDKTILVQYVSAEINGVYTAAFRVINMVYMPISAILIASSTRFFQEGSNGLRPTLRMATRIILLGSLYCLVLALFIFIGAPLIPIILGESYALSTDIMRWFALLPLVLMLQNTYSDALTGADRQMMRSLFQVIIALICFGLNMVLVPQYSWMGSVAAIYISQATLAILVMALIIFLLSHEPEKNSD